MPHRICKVLVLATIWIISPFSFADIKHGLRDNDGRHMIPRGYVINTNDHAGAVDFNPEDYLRMVRMGANVQVIRLEMGKLSELGDNTFKPEYLARVKRATKLGREAGIKTVFKMTVYGAKGFSWEDLYLNKNNEQKTYINAWKHVWEAFKNNDYVIGYDLVNEPRKKDMDISYDNLTNQYLIPLYEKIIDAAIPYSDNKQFLIQTIFMNKGDAINKNQYAEITKKIDRKNIIFAPHIYQENLDYIAPTMERFDKESNLLDAPILIGEWGFPTLVTTDNSVKEQLNYIEFYIKTAETFDEMGVGSIKAWFLGNRSYQNFLPGGPSTWAIFSDEQAIGTVERKYITDIIARPYPQIIAGAIKNFKFHFATRTLDLNITSDNAKGVSRIFVGADRHYPDGFTVYIGDDLIMSKSPIKSGLEVHSSSEDTQPSEVIWDNDKQQLILLSWPKNKAKINIKIKPGIYKTPDSTVKISK
ncbi:cellulase family glycosylhydrolase [Pseudoalteromonas sp. SG43-5]|uniref:cellulase family glycosylhydrolase n=1 Tax=Pseudoalteromonas sp. SG43-5 TaxID=2760968 RepID=UPI00160440E0|nr:cellulase family glycosylhydrolase [Pseudoalteromonas sp. SG43-5]MBB1455717.1 cellulase family glycosylhydrolase [Pseudoalteromonas sp. SG43-5]